jgi:hypothetical protein
MTRTRRHRREIRENKIRRISAVLRYSANRDAYVLRGIGRRFGPIFKRRLS